MSFWLGATPAALGGTVQMDVQPDEPPTLTFTAATGESNDLFLLDAPSGYRLFDLGANLTAGPGCLQVAADEVFCGPFDLIGGGVESHGAIIDVLLGDENDRASVVTSVGLQVGVAGESGDDQLEFGGHCALLDRFCEIHLMGGGGADTLRGEAAILDGGADADTMSGTRTSMADYSTRTASVDVSGDGLANDGETGEGDNVLTPWVRGGSGNDTFTDISALGGDGDDTFTMESGIFDAFGDAGNDVLSGWAGDDYFNGGPGDDELNGGGGSDDLDGGGGDDILRGGEGSDFIYGRGGKDVLVGGTGRDWLEGNAGRDILRARDGFREFAIIGGAGFDRARIDRGLDVARSIEAFF